MEESRKTEEQKQKKSNIPRGPAATKAKNTFRDKHYDRGELTMPKGMKAVIQKIAKQHGRSFNEYVWEAVKEKVQQDTGEEMGWEKKS